MNAHARQSPPEHSKRHETQDVSIRLLVLSAGGLVVLILASLAIVGIQPPLAGFLSDLDPRPMPI